MAKCNAQHLKKYCSPRYGVIKKIDQKCLDVLQNKKDAPTGSPVGRYTKCLAQFKSQASKCLPSLKDRCEKSPFKGVKTVRATMQMVSVLLKRHPKLKVLHLFRDPRSVLLSRLKHQSFRSYLAKKSLVIESKFYCGEVEQDIKLRNSLAEQYPGRIREVVYEDFVKEPLKNAKAIYEFLEMPFTSGLEQWVTNKTKQAFSVAQKWKTSQIKETERRQIETNCQPLFDYVSGIWEPTS